MSSGNETLRERYENSQLVLLTNWTLVTAMDEVVKKAERDAPKEDRQPIISLEYSYAHALRAYVAYLAELRLQLTEQNV